MTEPELHDILLKISELEADVRVTKHAVHNIQMENMSLSKKFERIEERMSERIERIEAKMSEKLDKIVDKVSNLNDKQQRGMGFFAGVAFVITGCATIVLGIARLFFGAE